MKVNIKPDSVQFEELKSKLETNFPNYKFKVRTKNFLIGAKTGTIGAAILLKKDRIIVNGNFPSIGGQMLFMLCVVLLGFLIPIIIYFIAFHGKFKAFEKEICDYLATQYPQT